MREESVFLELLSICPGLEERLTNSTEEEIGFIADLVSTQIYCTFLY